jgi:hypothetical protein
VSDQAKLDHQLIDELLGCLFVQETQLQIPFNENVQKGGVPP